MAFTPGIAPSPLPSERIYFVAHARGLVGVAKDQRLHLSEADLLTLGLAPDGAHSIGEQDGRWVLGVAFEAPQESLPPGFELYGLRALATWVDSETFAIAARALHLTDWATTSRFCGRCGHATERSETERCMSCPRCQLTQYPRIAPAVITLVRKGDQALLARNARFPGAFFSTLAGFSEVGETLEETLIREVREEVGVDVHNLRYFGSQPWPFPHSLMIAFNAEWKAGEIVVEPSEIQEARWFRRDQLPQIPPSLSIARRLIDAWVADTAR